MRNLYTVFPDTLGTVAPELYGHFTEHIGGVIYGGIWVGKDSPIPNIDGFRKDIIDKLKPLRPAVVRWPGGCFAETYDWRDGIGDHRPVRTNWWRQGDAHIETNEVGTHEFLRFCELLGADAYVALNLSSCSALDAREWMEYCNAPEGSTDLARQRAANGHSAPFNVKYWGVGNESWLAGGNMTVDYYAGEYRKFSELLANLPFPKELIGVGPTGNEPDYHQWTADFMARMEKSRRHMDGLSIHYYCSNEDDPLNFTKDQWYQMMRLAGNMEEVIVRNCGIIQGFAMEKLAGLVIDEWGCWHPQGSGPSKGYNNLEQQSTVRDALVTAITLNIFNNHCDKVKMANVAQLVNNLHALFLTEGEKCITTPTYHVFRMFTGHMGAQAVRCVVEKEAIDYLDQKGKAAQVDDLSVSASYKDGTATITVANLNADADVQLQLQSVGKQLSQRAVMTVLTHEDVHACNTFEAPDNVAPTEQLIDTTQPITVPKAGIVSIKAMLA